MSLDNFKKGLGLFEQVSKKINEIGEYSKIEKVSFVYYNCINLENLEILEKHPSTENILAVTDLEIRKDNLITVDKEKWQKNKEKFYQLTKNAIFINKSTELASSESYSFLKSIINYYPIVILFSTETLKKKEVEKYGFSSYRSKENDTISCNINKKLKKFNKYTFEKFKEIDDLIITVSGLRSIKRGKNIYKERSGKEKELFFEGEIISESTVQKNQILNF